MSAHRCQYCDGALSEIEYDYSSEFGDWATGWCNRCDAATSWKIHEDNRAQEED